MFWNSNKKTLEKIRSILGWTAGGAYKRIDENRELLELLQEDAPAFLAKNSWVTGWLKCHDDFFCELVEQFPICEGTFVPNPGTPHFPRPWPAEKPIVPAAANKNWVEHAYPLQQITVRLQGTRHTEREALISQLETVLARLRSGHGSGEDHDDDFGYRFELQPGSQGPSFFDAPAGYR